MEEINLNNIYNNFFSKNDCSLLYHIRNKYSRFDAILTSGNSTVVIEYKRRVGLCVKYDSCLIEKQKYESLLVLMGLFNAPGFYITEFDDIIFIHEVTTDLKLDWKPQLLQRNNSKDGSNKLKEVDYLPYSKATWIISKKTWNRGTIKQLEDYITLKKQLLEDDQRRIIADLQA